MKERNIKKDKLMGRVFRKGKFDLYFFKENMDSKLYTEILKSRIGEIKVHWENKTNLQFDNDPKHKSVQAYEFYQENSIRIINWPIYSPDLNPIENI